MVLNNKGELLFAKTEFGKKSEARNRLLVDLLARTNFMEKAGTGIKRVTNACTENGNKVNFEFSDSFWVTIQTNNIKIVEKVTDRVTDRVTDNQALIMKFIDENPSISTNQLSDKIGISQRKIKENISKLKNAGLIKRIGSAKGGHWQIIGKD